MPAFTEEPAFRNIVESEQYGKLAPEKRKAFLTALGAMSAEERQQLAEGLKPAQFNMDPNLWAPQEGYQTAYSPEKPRTLKQQGESIAPLVVDTVGQTAGAYLGSYGGPAGMIAGEAAGSYLANQANRALGWREGRPFQDPRNLDDALAVGAPLALRAVGGAAKMTTRSGRKALQKFDEQKEIAQGKGNTAIIEADLAAKEANEANAGKMRDYVQGNVRTDQAIQEHEAALKQRPLDAQQQVKVGDYRGDYQASKSAALKAQPVTLVDFEDTANQLGLDLKEPAQALQKKGFVTLVDALGEWAGKEQPIQSVIRTHQKLGQAISKLRRSGGEELGAAKTLYASLSDELDLAAKGADPEAARAVESYLKGQAGFRKQLAMDDYTGLFGVKRGYTNRSGLGKEVKSQAILDGFDNLVANDRFFKGSFTPDELQALRSNLFEPGQLPAQSIPERPKFPVGADVPVTPDYSNAQSPLPQLHPANFPYGRMIVAGMLGGNAGAAALGQAGSNNLLGWIGRGLVAIPHGLSNFMLATPERQQILRSISAGQRNQLTPENAALIVTTIAKRLGYTGDEEPVK